MKNDVLVIEDLDSDFEMIRRGFRRVDTAQARLVRMRSLQEANSYLDHAALAEVPGLIVLDLRLTDGDGRELLPSFQKRTGWNAVPVVVWSASDEPTVQENCLNQGAQAFFPKAANQQMTRRNIDHITKRWLSTLSDS